MAEDDDEPIETESIWGSIFEDDDDSDAIEVDREAGTGLDRVGEDDD